MKFLFKKKLLGFQDKLKDSYRTNWRVQTDMATGQTAMFKTLIRAGHLD